MKYRYEEDWRELENLAKPDNSIANLVTNTLQRNMDKISAPLGKSGGSGLPFKLPGTSVKLTNPLAASATSTGASAMNPLGFKDLLKLFGLQTAGQAVGGLLGGGGGQGQQRQSFSKGLSPEQATTIDPRNSLYTAMQALQRFGQMQQDDISRGYGTKTRFTAPPGFSQDPAAGDPDFYLRKPENTWDIMQSQIPELFKRAQRRQP